MPATQASITLTDGYQASLRRLGDRTAQQVAAAWAGVDLEDLDRTLARWLRAAVTALTVSQRDAARLAVAYLAAFVAAETRRPPTAPSIDVDAYAGATLDGRPVTAVLSSAGIAVKLALRRSKQPDIAAQWGRNRAVRAVRTEVADASRGALGELIRNDNRITGWRRVTTGSACPVCLAAATGAIRRDDDIPEAHPQCNCIAEPVVRGVRERVQRPTGQQRFDAMTAREQDALFAGRGGAEKAGLLRSGKARLDDLITTHSHPEWRDSISETPLDALKR